MGKVRHYAAKPLWPGWFARYLCRKLGHFPYRLHPNICCRCGLLLIHGDPIQKEALK
jgi:hypothetical protein